MRIDPSIGQSAAPESLRPGPAGQATFGQTMLQLERDMWPGARAGDSPVGAPPHAQLPDARAGAFHEPSPLASSASPLGMRANSSAGVLEGTEEAPSSSRGSTLADLSMVVQSDGQDTLTMSVSQAMLHGISLDAAAEPDSATSFTVTTNHRRAASNDHIMISGEQAGGAIVLRFDAPLAQRKALFEAITTELRRRGLPLRPIIINGIVHAGSQGDHS